MLSWCLINALISNINFGIGTFGLRDTMSVPLVLTNEARIKKDVQNREEHAIALGKIRAKAYEAPVRDPQSSLKGE